MGLMVEIGDKAAQGRACGNLGNVHYLLGNFPRAIQYHTERLKIAHEFGDKAAERRAHSNLGNAHIFLGEFERAADQYKRTLILAQELGDRAVEAQACYSLGNTYTLLKDYAKAVEYHLKHLAIAQELYDKVGEGRACWSLGNAYASLGNHREAYHYAVKHHEICQVKFFLNSFHLIANNTNKDFQDTGDSTGQATAQMNIAELSRALGYPEGQSAFPNQQLINVGKKPSDSGQRRMSMEQMDLIKLTPDAKNLKSRTGQDKAPKPTSGKENQNLNKSGYLDEEDIFDVISRQVIALNVQRPYFFNARGGSTLL